MIMPWQTVLFNRRMLLCILTGFSSGLPLYLLINLVPAWLRTEGLDLKTIGFFALIQLPYTWKFAWSFLLDRYHMPVLGRRRGWILLSQISLFIAIALLGTVQPALALTSAIVLTLSIAFLSATQDIALDAFRREILSDAELGLGNAIHVNAYRIAGLVPGSLSLILADYYPWSVVFLVTALFMLPGMAIAYLGQEPKIDGTITSLRQAIVEPFNDMWQRNGWSRTLAVLSFLVLYKLGDSMATSLATPFYLDMGYSKSDIGLIAKNASLWPMVVSGIVGGIWMLRIGINRALWWFGLVQILTILGFVWLAVLGPQEHIATNQRISLAVVIAAEAVGAGLGTAAFIAFIARETNPKFSATQFALFTSVAALPRTVISAYSGQLIEAMGYIHFFWLCFFLAVPGMIILLIVAPYHANVRSEKPPYA